LTVGQHRSRDLTNGKEIVVRGGLHVIRQFLQITATALVAGMRSLPCASQT
jgi:hypothetical protein